MSFHVVVIDQAEATHVHTAISTPTISHNDAITKSCSKNHLSLVNDEAEQKKCADILTNQRTLQKW